MDSLLALLGRTLDDGEEKTLIARQLYANKFTVPTLIEASDFELDGVISDLFPEVSLGAKLGFKTSIRSHKKESVAPPENLAKALDIVRRYEEQAPSSFDLHTVRRVQNHRDGPLFRCDRSHVGTLPGPLLHPIFGEFEDNLQNSTLLTREDHSFVKELCDTSTEFLKNESTRQSKVFDVLGFYLKRQINSGATIEDASNMACDGCIRGNSPFPIYAIFEVENELASTSTLKDFQGLAYYSRFCIVGKESTAYLFSTCPAFLIELRGPHIRVTAMTYQDQVTASFLTCVENIVHSNSMRLASVFKALKLGLDSLETFYDSIQGKAEGSKRLPFLDKFAPYSLWLNPNYKFKNSIANKQLVFLAEDANKREVVIKFCRRYGDQVHRAWYDRGYAPELIKFQRLPGGFYLVAMEFLGDPWKTFLSLDDQEKTECRSVVLDALKKVHGLSVFGPDGLSVFGPENAGSVHGDAREGNIMVRRRNGVFEVKFIDFDWAGQHGVSTYPPKMNHVQIAWPDGVSDGMPMEQRHDVDIVSNPPGASSYSWRRHV